jgi:hypothetical protein
MSDPVDLPTAEDLLQIVRELLVDSVLPATSGPLAYQVRIAANLLSIVLREMELGPTLLDDRHARLEAIGFGSEVDLAMAVRAGRLDSRWSDLKNLLQADVADRLAVSNPGYLVE